MMLLVYNLWLARNEARDSDRIADPADIVRKTLAGLEEWFLANNMAPKENSAKVEHWLPPEPNWFKVNVDGAFRSAENKGGGGAVIRDCHGHFFSGASHFPPRW
jgi:hypothetical protein